LKTSLLLPITLVFFLISCQALAQTQPAGVRGVVKSNDEGNLPYATIFVKQNGSGTTTNQEGQYEIELAPGWYDIVFQFLGYETTLRKVEVTNGFVQLDVTMKSQPTILPEVVTGGNAEDPAYTIMRKAIAKANYHRNELDTYSARVYIKGVGKLKDYPWLAKKAVEKEGIKKNQAFVSESVSDVKYTRPNKFEEKVISIRSDGKDNSTSPNQFVFGSFYEPTIAETVSPLSPKAFSYYKFEYLGTFKDREYDVSRIKVIPRSKGDNVVDGEIYIVENWWSIHSVDIHTTKLGIDIWVKMMCAPVEDKVWLPVSHRFKVDGKFFGFEFEYNYLATVSNYKIQVNPKVYVEPSEMDVIDEKIEKEEAKEIVKKNPPKSAKDKAKEDKNKQLQDRLTAGKEITRKELNTLMKEYEKEEIKQSKEPEVVSNVSFKIDSGAYKNDSVYWTHIRPVPLSVDEVVGYQKTDSMAEVNRKKEAGDTLKNSKHKGFQPWDLLVGDNYKVGKHSNFRIHFPMPGFNTVEGLNLVYRLSFGTILQDTNRTRFTVSPTFRYAFSREKLSGNLAFALRNKNYRLELSGGRYIDQYNADQPILPILNTLTTLLLEQNLMKIYERDYVDLRFRKKFNDYIGMTSSWSYATRRELFNDIDDFKIVDRKSIEGYTPNRPFNVELANTGFNEHQAFVGAAGINVRPWLKFRIRNDRRIEIPHSSPTISFDYRKGFSVFGSDVDFDQIELGLKHDLKVGVRGNLTFALRGGLFLNASQMYFMDYKHFLGNRTPFSTSDPVGSFRLLDYYANSTSDKYFAGNVHYHFRKFMVTRIPIVRMTGIRENFFVNYLATPSSQNYTELGYGIEGILRLFRIEVAAAFQDGKYLDYGIRIGIATSLTVNFSD
jgi:hypothetical protein